MQHTKTFFIFFYQKKAQASQLIAIKINKPCAYILAQRRTLKEVGLANALPKRWWLKCALEMS
jgi:hypothetical protein